MTTEEIADLVALCNDAPLEVNQTEWNGLHQAMTELTQARAEIGRFNGPKCLSDWLTKNLRDPEFRRLYEIELARDEYVVKLETALDRARAKIEELKAEIHHHDPSCCRDCGRK